jgi:hypothetical protein
MGMKTYIRLLGLLLVACTSLSTTAKAAAGDIAEQPCDPKYWDSLTARAWMEAEREIIQNQNLIFKPDSVLEYTCFDKFVDHAAENAGNIFVHTMYFGKMIIPKNGNESMKSGLTNVVATALKAYDDGSFKASDFMADRAALVRDKGGTSKYDQPAAANYGTYQCNVMQNVWKTAKCINFIDNANFKMTDGFYPFKQIKGLDGTNVAGYQESFSGDKDPRKWPAALKCAGPDQNEWKSKDDIAANLSEQYKFKQPLAQDFQKVRQKIEPGQCGTAIKTGVKVIVNGQEAGDDGVCTNPGCTYKDNKCE